MITLELEKCSGCSRCEVHCSFFHSGKIGRSGARIKVVKIEAIGIDYPVVCQHCQERYCTKCPENAIEVGPQGHIIVSPTLCTACGTCEIMCPIGAIELFEEFVYVCDLCGGFEPEVTEAVSLKQFKKGSRRLTPEQKRLQFTLACSQDLRDQWVSERSG
jgi:Fe-S-cluster-containing hydrogenase component 2